MKKLIAMLGAVVAAVTSAWAANIGDTVTWSNMTSTSEFADTVYRACQYAVTLPAQDGLPVGSTVKVKKVTFAGWDTTYNAWDTSSYKSDFFTIQLNGVKSGNLNGSADKNNVVYPETVADGIPALTYAFSSDCVMTVGQSYVARTDTSLAAAGEGMTLMHDNGKCNAQNGVGVSSVRHVATAGVIGAAVGDGLYPACIVEAEVVSIPVAFDGGDSCTISAANAATSGDQGSITMNDAGVITIDASPDRDYTIISDGMVKIAVGESYTLTPADLAKFTFLTTSSELTLENATVADNLVIPSGMTLVSKGTTTIAKATFAPNTALTVETGVLTIETTKKYNASDANRGLQGNITIKSGAELVLKSSDALNYDSSANVYVYGTWTNDGTARQSINGNTKIFVYNGGSITGAGDGRGALHFYASNRLVVSGVCTISAAIQMRDAAHVLTIAQTRGANSTVDNANSSTATFSGVISGAGSLIKGAATVAEGNINNKTDAGNAYCKFSGANTFTGSFTHKNSCGTLILLPGVTMPSVTSETGTGFDFGSSTADAEGVVTITGACSHQGNQIKCYTQTTVGGAMTSTNGVDLKEGSKLTTGDGTELAVAGTGSFSGKGLYKVTGGIPGMHPDENFTGTFWIQNKTGWTNIDLNSYGNANSTVRLTGVAGHLTQYANVLPTVELQDVVNGEGAVTTKALDITNGWTGNLVTINKLTGNGTLEISAGPVKMLVRDSSEFTGTAAVTVNGEAGLIFGNPETAPTVGKNCVFDTKLTILPDATIEIAEGKTWSAPGGVVVNGVLKTHALLETVPTTSIQGKEIVAPTEAGEDGLYIYEPTDPPSVGPTTWEDVTAADLAETDLAGISSEGLTALKAWAQGKGNVAIDDIASINVNCFLMNVANSSTDPELKITADDLAKILAAESLEAAAEALKETYPNAEITVEDVTESICGEGATNTHLYQLKLSLPTAQN